MSIDPVELLQRLVAIPSVSGREQDSVNFLVQQMTALGLEAHVDGTGNAVGARNRAATDGGPEREIILLGHIDTVPGDIPVRQEDGCLYGRGTVDAKGPLAAFVVAAARASLPPGLRLVVVGAVEEEAATSKGAHYVADRYRPAACIIGEPSGWNAITLGYKGRLLLDYQLQQPMGHTAGPQQAVAERAVAWWNALCADIADFNEGRQRLFDRLLPSLRRINTGSDGLTNSVSLQVGLRLPPDFDADKFMIKARKLAEEATVRPSGYEAAYAASRRTPLVQAFNGALRRRGQRPRHLLKTGTSDMNVVGPRWNCPILAYGPGDSNLDHTPQEHIVIDDYVRAIEVLVDVLERL